MKTIPEEKNGRQNLLIVSVLVLLTVTSAAAIAFLPKPIVEKMIESDIRAQAEVWEARLLRNLEEGAVTFRNGIVSLNDSNHMMGIPESSDIYRIKLFDRGGRVFWSTRRGDVGSRVEADFWSEVIAQGTVVYEKEYKAASDIDTFQGLPSDGIEHLVVEMYRPIFHDGRFVGAIEFYYDITALYETFINRIQVLLAGVSSVLVVLLLLVLTVVIRTARSLAKTQARRAREDNEGMARQLRLAKEVQLLGELNEWLQSSASLRELFDMVARFMEHLLPESAGSIYVYSNSRDVLDGAASWNGGVVKDHIRPSECWGLRRGRTYKYGKSDVNFVCGHAEPHDGVPYFCFPVLAHGETVGLMHLKSLGEGNHDAFLESRKMAQMCAEQISLAIANVRMRDELHDQSVRDPLTGLFNRRHFMEAIRKAAQLTEQKGIGFGLVSIDVDHFKKFNDTFGHDAGDIVLRSVGKVFEEAVDGEEVACRFGGEEFMLLLPYATLEQTEARAEKIRKDVEKLSVRYGEKTLPKITLSAGVVAAPEHGLAAQELVKTADDALYDAKAKGRNCVVIAELVNEPRRVAKVEDSKAPNIAAE